MWFAGRMHLLEAGVEFKRLGLAIVDEQHRFGVEQRQKLMEKGEHPDVLVMTATPIPRTLALTIYGDLDVSVIDEMPPGRKPILTKQVDDAKVEQVYSFLKKQIDLGHQAYVVYPVIEESETQAMKAAQKMHEQSFDDRFSGRQSRAAAREIEDRRQGIGDGEVPARGDANPCIYYGYRSRRGRSERYRDGH